LNFAIHGITRFFIGQTGRDLTLQSPLLVDMTMPESSYMQALARFRHRTAIANVRNDIQVVFSTAAIALRNPYDLSLKFRTPESPVRVRGCSPSLRRIPAIDILCGSYTMDINAHAPKANEYGQDYDTALRDLDVVVDSEGLASVCRRMHARLHRVGWRHVDLELDAWSTHDAVIGKSQPLLFPFANVRCGEVAMAMLADLVVYDHVQVRQQEQEEEEAEEEEGEEGAHELEEDDSRRHLLHPHHHRHLHGSGEDHESR
jgi:hypothetical protein